MSYSRIAVLGTAVVLSLFWAVDSDMPNSASAQTSTDAERPAVTSDAVDGYMVLAPSVLRSGQTESISVSLFSGQDPARGTVGLTLYDFNATLASASGDTEGTGSISLSVPKISAGNYYLKASGPGFSETVAVTVDSGDILFVETDKPLYKPGQDMHIRVLLLDIELKPLTGDITVEVRDAKGNKVYREVVQSDEFGMANLTMPLSNEPNLGNWNISASYGEQEADTQVSIEQYVLPKYEIGVDFAQDWGLVDEPIKGTVTAEYSFGKPVKGELRIVASKYTWEWEEFAEFTAEIDGTASFELPEPGYVSGGRGPDGAGNISLEVTVEEKETGYKETTTASHTVVHSSVSLRLIPEGSSFKPSLPFSVLLVTESPDRSLTDYEVGLETYYLDDGLTVTYAEESRLKTVDGKALLTITPPTGSVAVAILADAGGSYASTLLKAAHSPSNSFIHLEQVSSSLSAGDHAQFKAHSTEPEGNFHYEVISRGRVVLSDVSASSDIGFTVTPVMANMSKLVVYQVMSNGEVAADTLPFTVADSYPLDIDAAFDKAEVRPGDEVEITLTTDGQAKVGVTAVDRSVYLLGDNRINLRQVFDELDRFNLEPEIDYYDDYYYSEITTLGAAETLKDAGLVVMSNREVPVGRTHYRRPLGSGGFADVAALSASAPGAGSDDLADVRRVRQFFPETWLWSDVMTDESGSASIAAEAPDSITTWILRAVGMSKEHGLGIAETQLRVFQPFFLQVDLPYSAIRGEEFSAKVVLHNYLDTSQQFFVELEESEDFELLDDAAKTVTVGPNDLKVVHFKMRLTELGSLPIKVTARSRDEADAVIRELLVVPEGVPQEIVTNKILSGGESAAFSNALPSGSIERSARTHVALSGSVLGQTLEGLENLLQMSYGCGEQNMVLFAPNVFVARYLEQTGQLKPELMSRAEHLMMTGYQQQLMFRRADGSFATWGDRSRSGSIWLTAFVLKTLAQAKSFIYVDPEVISGAAQWILDHQNEDGSFEQVGGVPNSYLYGGLEGATALAAYVAVALHEAGATGSADLAIGYLEDRLDEIEDPYTIALVSYALELGDSASADEAHDLLLEKGTRDQNGLYWDTAGPQADSAHSWWARSTAVENTGYAVLALLEHGDLANARAAARWLVTQRNAYGGYRSTQDTVVGLQALIQYSVETQNDVDMTVTLTSGDWTQEVKIDAENADIVQVVSVPVGDNIQLVTDGAGEAVVQVVHRFNLPEDQLQPGEIFSLDVDYSPKSVTVGDAISVSATVDFEPPVELDVGMVILDIALPTGFSPVLETLDALVDDNPKVWRYDLTERSVELYLEDLVANETFEVTFDAVAGYPVITQPTTSKVYSYYNPRWSTETLGPSVIVAEDERSVCLTGGAVNDGTNAGLITDCETLLLARDTLAGNATLNWSEGTAIADWEGVTLQGSPERVTTLTLSDSGLNGELPDLSGLAGLVRLDLRDNMLSGDIPSSFGEMTSLIYLYLHNNDLDGSIPSELGGMSSLRYLWLHSNDLSGNIPSELGNLDNLRDLNLHSNNLTGDIPAELGEMDSLTHLRLHRNELTGAIPGELGDLDSLRFMWLHGNMLDGLIPSSLGSLEKLERLWLSENKLTGAVPAELGELSGHSLVQWRLSGGENRFTGCLPAGLAAVEDSDMNSLGLQTCSDS